MTSSSGSCLSFVVASAPHVAECVCSCLVSLFAPNVRTDADKHWLLATGALRYNSAQVTHPHPSPRPILPTHRLVLYVTCRLGTERLVAGRRGVEFWAAGRFIGKVPFCHVALTVSNYASTRSQRWRRRCWRAGGKAEGKEPGAAIQLCRFFVALLC